MPPLTDPERLRHYREALKRWSCSGYVTWEPFARQWVRKNLAGFTPPEVSRLMWEHVQAGGEIDEVRERRPEWSEHKFHHDLRLKIAGRLVYVETRLLMDERDIEHSTINVVNIHDA
ncbi:MAG TPA: hypothetical protein VM487_01710 [Phycisphaerae bacterium]|nr:hypothetical protein [Phycisphaerae bacterium]